MKDLTDLKVFLKLSKKECSGLQKSLILTRLEEFNRKNGTSHSIEWTQAGQADLYTWSITERWNDQRHVKPVIKSNQLRLRL
jgi:hypothetical protein